MKPPSLRTSLVIPFRPLPHFLHVILEKRKRRGGGWEDEGSSSFLFLQKVLPAKGVFTARRRRQGVLRVGV
jgi:hypothetical protein